MHGRELHRLGQVPGLSNIGYPLVEAARRRHRSSSPSTPAPAGSPACTPITEQLLYEMGTPAYLAPDCIAHFDSIRLEQESPDRVRVSGIRG